MADAVEPDKPFHCPKAGCTASFETDFQRQGHIGGAHVRRKQFPLPIKHGTVEGYRAHVRHKVMPPCLKCKKAWAAFHRARRAKKGSK